MPRQDKKLIPDSVRPYVYYEEPGIVLLHGDCLEILPLLESDSIDLVLTDPPYGTTACKWDSVIPIKPMWEVLEEINKINGTIILTATQPFASMLVSSNLDMFKYEYIWLKERGQSFILAKKQPIRAHEVCLVFYKKQPTYNPQMTEAPKDNIRKPQRHTSHKSEVYGIEKMASKDYDKSKRYPLSYALYKTGRSRSKVHPTQKPLALFEWLIKTYTNKNNVIIDFCLGSGTTAVAAKQFGRKCIGIEIEAKYLDIAIERLRQPGDEVLFTKKELKNKGIFY